MAKPTHIILEKPSQQYETLYRCIDGMRLATRHNAVVLMGEDPNKAVSRVFLDNEFASKYIHHDVPAKDLETRGIKTRYEVEVKSDEGVIVLPDGAMALPGGRINPLN